MTVFFGAKSVAFAAVMTCLSGAVAADETGRIAVSGMGEITVAPDMARITLGVSHDAMSAADALSGMSAAMDRVIARIAAAGIDEADFQTGSLQLNQRYDPLDNGRRVPAGYTAYSDLNVRVRALDTLGDVLDAAVTDGANDMRGLVFDIADRSELLVHARQAAVADARAKAEIYAQAAGVALGKVISISEGSTGSGPSPMMAEMAFDSARRAVPVAAGELAVTAQINIIWALK